MEEVVSKLKAFMENEARSCSMDFGCITPEYVQRMLGGVYPIEEIRTALSVCLNELYERERAC
jgi:hypothetical protein